MVSDKKIFMGICHKGGVKLKKIFSAETAEPISSKLC
jgi:hypothetical protein